MTVVQEHKVEYRFVLLMASGMFAVFGSRTVHFSGAGPLAVITIPFVAALSWRKEISQTAEVSSSKAVLPISSALLLISSPVSSCQYCCYL